MSLHGIEVIRQDDVVVARLDGDIDLANTPIVSARVLEAVPNDVLGLVLDLSEVRYIDSVGIRMLFTFVRSLHASRQGMAIALPPDAPVRNLLKITNLDEVTVFRPSVDEAIIALRESGTPQY
ncbi:MAG TPA: STAS domain-containing protein [Acidimicrobiia bacterium]|nr:STAS domain-containing protein [Acidimicrobiia bacterium]